MLVKAKGTFVWHSHPEMDDFFLVLKGNRVIQLRNGPVRFGPGDLYAVPRGVEHRPVAEEEVTSCLSNLEACRTPETQRLRLSNERFRLRMRSRVAAFMPSRHSIRAASRFGAIKR
jgi:mannose-6-phosphate isomerase-like protein (cupin superfamily)